MGVSAANEVGREPVRLVRARRSDAAAILAWRREPSAARFQPLRTMSERELAFSLGEREREPLDATLNGEVQWLIVTANGAVGWLTLKVVNREHGVAEIGYTVSEIARGRGVATAAVRALVPFALAPDGLDFARLQAIAAVDNVASRRVLEGAGFRLEGIARGYLIINEERVDHATYGLLRSDCPVD